MPKINQPEQAPNDVRTAGERAGEPRPWELLFAVLFDFCRGVGVFYRRFLRVMYQGWCGFYHRYLHRHFHKLDLAWLRVVKFFSRVKQHVFFYIYMFFKFFVDAWHVVRDGFNRRRGANFFVRLGGAAAAFFRGVWNNRRIFVSLFNYALPIAAAVLLVNLIGYVSRLNFVVDVQYNGEHLGYVKNETVYTSAAAALQQRILYQQGEDVLDQIPRFSVTIARPDEVAAAETLTDTMMQLSNDDVSYGTGIWVDSEFLGVVRDSGEIEATLAQLLDAYRTEDENEVISFSKNISLSRGYYLQSNFREESEILAILTKEEEQDVFDTIQSGDAPLLIAQRNNMSLDELVALNPDILDNCVVGHTVKVHSSKAYLPIKVTRQETYEEAIPYATNNYNSSAYWEGQKITTTAGVNGLREVTANISYVDGVEVSREILTTTVLTEPVTRQVAIGTKPMPKVSDISGAKVSDYGLIWPVQNYGAYISQHYGNVGYSYGGVPHRGTDFGGLSYGTPVVAVLPGTVTFAGWNGTYGYQVKIDHGNGMVTTYAHNSKLNVSRGDVVAQGQVIAGAGQTGRSFGIHVHLELYINGVRVNPEKYLP